MIIMKRFRNVICRFHPRFCKLDQTQCAWSYSTRATSSNSCSSKEADFELVISGISGRFPQSDNIDEFRENLFVKRDMVEVLTKFKAPRSAIPARLGKLKNLDKFDAQFFGIIPKLADYMDPTQRKLLEVTFEAMIDAGINPTELEGTSTGVFVASQGEEYHAYWQARAQPFSMEGHGPVCAGYSLANRISFVFNFKGTSYVISSACSGSLHALEAAVRAIESGSCSAAIVAGCTIHTNAFLTMDFNNLGALAADGACKAFDVSGTGFARSEAVSAILIQKKNDAKRAYASIKGVLSSSDGFKNAGFNCPSGIHQQKLFKKIYTGSGIDPGQIKYVEAHGTGTPVGDPEELQSVSNVFCKAPSRTEPLLIGSVKSNMGHGESAAASCGIAKVIIAIQEGQIPPNLHFKKPRPETEHLFDGSIQVVTEVTPFTGGLIGLNSFGIGGTNAHLILEVQSGTKSISTDMNEKQEAINSQIPVILPFSGRTEDAVKKALEKACEKSRAENSEVCGLIHNIFKTNVKGHPFRGFALYNPALAPEQGQDTKDLKMEISPVSFGADKRPICFIFSGAGSQWNQMGKDLQKLDVFRESLNRSKQTLKNLGFDLDETLKPNNPVMFENAQHLGSSIGAIQIALYDTLISLKILPDMYIGHSFSEVLCGYADGTFTAEEALQVLDIQGRATKEFVESNKNRGLCLKMVSVGMSWDELASSTLPANVYLAAKNSERNVAISGEVAAVNSFVKKLKDDGVLVKEIKTCGYSAHTPLIYSAADMFGEYGSNVFPKEKKSPRSEKWISSSVHPSEWGSELAKYNSIAYHVNNMKMPVLFHESVQRIPENAVVIEVAPQKMLESILKDSLPSENFVITPMTLKKEANANANAELKADQKAVQLEDKLSDFLSSVGKIYNSGVSVDFSGLYPPVSFPVAAATPGLGSLIKWNHEDSWTVPIISNPFKDGSQGITLTVDTSTREYQFLKDHKLDGRVIVPGTGYLYLAWKSLACYLAVDMNELPVVFENVAFKRATFLKENLPVVFRFTMSHSSGQFEIKEQDALVVTGTIKQVEKREDFRFACKEFDSISSSMDFSNSKSSYKTGDTILQTKDVYKEIRLRGLEHYGEFQAIQKFNLDENCGEIKWSDNWTAFLDAVLQSMCLSMEYSNNRHCVVPVQIQELKIDPKLFHAFATEKTKQKQSGENLDILIPFKANNSARLGSLPGLEVSGLIMTIVPRKRQEKFLTVKDYQFSPYFDETPNVGSSGAVIENNQKVLENIQVAGIIDLVFENGPTNLKIMDIFSTCENSLANVIHETISSMQRAKASVKLVSTLEEMEKLDEATRTAGSSQIVESMSDINSDNFSLDSNADLIFLDNNIPANLEKISCGLNENSFLVLHSFANADRSQPDDEISFPNLVKLSEKYSPNLLDHLQSEHSSVRLQVFRKKTSSVFENNEIKTLAIDSGDSNFEWLPKLQELMSDGVYMTTGYRIYLTSQSNATSGILGLVNCLRQEAGGEYIRCIFDPEKTLQLNFENPDHSLSDIIEKDLVMNVVKNGKVGSYRHFPLPKDISLPSKHVEHAFVNTLTTGDLTSLRWIESPLTFYRKNDNETNKLCTVHYSALNFRDIMLASGRLSTKMGADEFTTSFGLEFSGLDPDGNRVMGMVVEKGIATSVLASPHLLFGVPDHWLLEEAVTVPSVYLTAYYALHCRGQLKPGHSVLIHSGTGGTGQAAINLALAEGCEIFTTVGNEEKRQFIKTTFPTIPDKNIFSSRDCQFQPKIMERTSGRGVDLVLNSLSEDKFHASVRCVAKNGNFLEIGKFEMAENTGLGMSCFFKNIGFEGIDLVTVCEKGDQRLFQMFDSGVKNGVVKPLKRNVFNAEQIEDAFRFMANGKHMGKVVIKVKDELDHTTSTRTPARILAIPQTYFHCDKTYIIAGGLSGFGFEVANWLVARGAKKLILTSRSGVKTGYHNHWLKNWTERGVNVKTEQIDLSNYETARDFFENLSKKKRKVGGIFNSSLVMKDDVIENQTIEMFQAVAAPKGELTKNLDQLSRQFCPELDYFIVFSSTVCGLGNAGQSGYGMASSVMERICEQRKADGLHALAIEWGAIGDTGYVSEKMAGENASFLQGSIPQPVHSCLEVLDYALNQDSTILSSVMVDKTLVTTGADTGILQTFSSAFGIKDLASIHPNTKLTDLGMDSLIAVEIKQTLERDHDLSLTPPEIRSLTFGNLQAIDAGSFKKGDVSKRKDKTNLEAIRNLLFPQEILVKLPSKSTVNNQRAKLFIVHGLDGFAQHLKPLASQLETCDLYGFQFSEEVSPTSVQDIAAQYIKEMKKVQSEGPYNIGGYSSGGVMGFEIINQLESQHNDKVSNFIILDGCISAKNMEKVESDVVNSIKGFINEQFGADKFKETVSERLTFDEFFQKCLLNTFQTSLDKNTCDEIQCRLENYAKYLRGLCAYDPSRNFQGNTILILASDKQTGMYLEIDIPTTVQSKCKGPLSVHEVNGNHQTFLNAANVHATAKILNQQLKCM